MFFFILIKQKRNHVLDPITFTSSRMTRPAGRESFRRATTAPSIDRLWRRRASRSAFVRLAGTAAPAPHVRTAPGASGECKVAIDALSVWSVGRTDSSDNSSTSAKERDDETKLRVATCASTTSGDACAGALWSPRLGLGSC
jgi:hypothetical protein